MQVFANKISLLVLWCLLCHIRKEVKKENKIFFFFLYLKQSNEKRHKTSININI